MSVCLEESYRATLSERRPFGDYWCGPDVFEHATPVKVAWYDGQARGSAGRYVEVWCTACPARFYELHVSALTGRTQEEHRKAYKLSTGSGGACAELAARCAEAIARGMFGLKQTAGD